MRRTHKQSAAAFEAAKATIIGLVEELAGHWVELALSDDEIHRISDAAIEAALNVENE